MLAILQIVSYIYGSAFVEKTVIRVKLITAENVGVAAVQLH